MFVSMILPGEKVLDGSAEVAQPTTAYGFTGRGAHEWICTTRHPRLVRYGKVQMFTFLPCTYGFSVVEIAKENTKEKTFHFGGIKDRAIHQGYMNTTYDTMDKDGNIKTLPLIEDLNVRICSPFAQIPLVVTEEAALEDMSHKCFVYRDSAFAGHS